MIRITIATAALVTLALAGCGGDDGDSASTASGGSDRESTDSGGSVTVTSPIELDGFVGVDGAQKLVDTLNAHNIKTDTPQPAEPGYVQGVGGTGWDLDINADGFGDGINLFPNAEALSAWVELSKAFGGIAVTGDTWAVSLDTNDGGRATSERLAPRVAEALGGKVQR
jgi:hypothetical protein